MEAYRSTARKLRSSGAPPPSKDAWAQFSMGVRYDDGLNVPPDYMEVLKWYQAAAEQGVSSAQNNLRAMYDHGRGVPKNAAFAYALFNVSAANGPSKAKEAMINRDSLAKSMTAKQVEAGQHLSRELAKPGSLLAAIDKHSRR